MFQKCWSSYGNKRKDLGEDFIIGLGTEVWGKVKMQDKNIPDKAQACIFEDHTYPAMHKIEKNINQRNIRK